MGGKNSRLLSKKEQDYYKTYKVFGSRLPPSNGAATVGKNGKGLGQPLIQNHEDHFCHCLESVNPGQFCACDNIINNFCSCDENFCACDVNTNQSYVNMNEPMFSGHY